MKKLLMILLILVFATMAFAETASWTAPTDVSNVDGYKLRYSVVGEDAFETLEVGVNETSIVINGLLPETRYRFWVVSYNSAGESGAATRYYTTPEIIIIPGDPTDLNISITININ